MLKFEEKKSVAIRLIVEEDLILMKTCFLLVLRIFILSRFMVVFNVTYVRIVRFLCTVKIILFRGRDSLSIALGTTKHPVGM